jgi:hypothetical protein
MDEKNRASQVDFQQITKEAQFIFESTDLILNH